MKALKKQLMVWALLFSFGGWVVQQASNCLTHVLYNYSLKTFEISVRLQTPDLERALTAYNQGGHVEISKGNKPVPVLINYLKEKFMVMDEGEQQPRQWNFIGNETKNGVTWVTLEVPCHQNCDSLKVRNTIFTEMIEGQVNIVQAEDNKGSVSTFKLDKTNPTIKIKF